MHTRHLARHAAASILVATLFLTSFAEAQQAPVTLRRESVGSPGTELEFAL